MNKRYSIFAVFVLALFVVCAASSCRKSTYPRETFRGAGKNYDPTTYRSNRVKAKKYKSYKKVRAVPSSARHRR